jgi:hypothetical protein
MHACKEVAMVVHACMSPAIEAMAGLKMRESLLLRLLYPPPPFDLQHPNERHHVLLLLSTLEKGYSTYISSTPAFINTNAPRV